MSLRWRKAGREAAWTLKSVGNPTDLSSRRKSGFYVQFAELYPDEKLTTPDSDR